MPATHYGSFPILLPGVTQSISRNGLQKTSGTILCLPGQEADALSLAEAFGSVFPDVSTRTMDTGLVEVSFDAYQAAGSPTTLRGSLVVTLSKSFEGTYTNSAGAVAATTWTVVETWLVDTVTTFTTVDSKATSGTVSVSSPALSRSLKKRNILGRVGSGGAGSLTIAWTPDLTDVTRRNFGDIDEADVTYSLTATIAP